jgi:chromosome segregation ATPase
MKKQKKQTRTEAIAASTAHDYAHQHTTTINSRRRVLEFEGGEVERAIVALTAALADNRRRLAHIDAELRGLATVVGKR